MAAALIRRPSQAHMNAAPHIDDVGMNDIDSSVDQALETIDKHGFGDLIGAPLVTTPCWCPYLNVCISRFSARTCACELETFAECWSAQ
jgi:hypothetical protein